MKTIGLIGGMSWESTVTYYREINETIKKRLGGLHSAKLLLYSLDFHEVERLQRSGDWDVAGELLVRAACSLESAGADILLICANTMHKVAPAVEGAVALPLLHIVDPTAEQIKRARITRVGLLGTRFTMEQDFYRDRLQSLHGIDVLVPEVQDREIVHRVIYDELCLGKILPNSREAYRTIMADLKTRGAEAIILGCTELPLLVSQEDSAIPLVDTTRLHAQAAADWAISS